MTISKTESNSSGQANKPANNENLNKKIVIRRLPPSMTKDQFLDIISPMPEYDFFYFSQADMSLGVNAFSRAYIYFKDYEDIFPFRDRFDNYIFLDSKSNEYPAIVEFAPYQRRYKFAENTQKKDSKCNTINEDSDYLKFLENFDKPSGEALPSCESILEELEQRDREKDETGSGKMMTPLLEYMRRKREDKKQLLRERDREAKKRREDEKRFGNSGRDKRRDRDREYKEKRQNQNEKSSGASQQQQNVKIMSRQQNYNDKDQGATEKNKEPQKSSEAHGKNNLTKSSSSNSSKSTPSHSYRENRDRERDNRENNKSNSSKNNYGSGNGNNKSSGGGGKSYRNHSEAEHKQKFSADKADSKIYDKSENKSDAKTSRSEKLEKSEANGKVKEARDGKDNKQKRPSIQIYNPGQRAAQREQKKDKQPES